MQEQRKRNGDLLLSLYNRVKKTKFTSISGGFRISDSDHEAIQELLTSISETQTTMELGDPDKNYETPIV